VEDRDRGWEEGLGGRSVRGSGGLDAGSAERPVIRGRARIREFGAAFFDQLFQMDHDLRYGEKAVVLRNEVEHFVDDVVERAGTLLQGPPDPLHSFPVVHSVAPDEFRQVFDERPMSREHIPRIDPLHLLE